MFLQVNPLLILVIFIPKDVFVVFIYKSLIYLIILSFLARCEAELRQRAPKPNSINFYFKKQAFHDIITHSNLNTSL